MLVRRVWGKLATDKVTVEVYTHYAGSQSVPERQQIPLGKDDALVVFELKNGRRVQPIAQQQLANAVVEQAAVGRQILAQQLAALNNPAALGSLLASRGSLGNGGGIGGGAINPFFARGAVGYQPVIVTLPEGANMGTTAVVSHDRRYVRITPSPIFSGISEVNTFNYVSGTSGTSNGGTGGQGFGGGGGGGGFGGGGSGGGGGFGGF